uniref:Uncharacterized protein n=1 Tax=Cannabis sativa TaxID=3483 RepID=A0A803P9H0_CANSA
MKRKVFDVVAQIQREIEKLEAEIKSLKLKKNISKQEQNEDEDEEEGHVAHQAYVPQKYAYEDEGRPQNYSKEFVSLNEPPLMYNVDEQRAANQLLFLCSDNIDNIVARAYL